MIGRGSIAAALREVYSAASIGEVAEEVEVDIRDLVIVADEVGQDDPRLRRERRANPRGWACDCFAYGFLAGVRLERARQEARARR